MVNNNSIRGSRTLQETIFITSRKLIMWKLYVHKKLSMVSSYMVLLRICFIVCFVFSG